jgi:hypothetical protein
LSKLTCDPLDERRRPRVDISLTCQIVLKEEKKNFNKQQQHFFHILIKFINHLSEEILIASPRAENEETEKPKPI